jgi:molybdopterin converting factor small subunit
LPATISDDVYGQYKMKIRIKMFASIKEACKFEERELIVSDGISVREIIMGLKKCHPALKNFENTLLCAINEEYCRPDSVLSDEDVLAIFPPVGGG